MVGEYFADLVVQNTVILELKVVEEIIQAHEAQLVNYLKATNLEVGLLLNFGPKPEFKHKIFTNARKANLKEQKRNPDERGLREDLLQNPRKSV